MEVGSENGPILYTHGYGSKYQKVLMHGPTKGVLFIRQLGINHEIKKIKKEIKLGFLIMLGC